MLMLKPHVPNTLAILSMYSQYSQNNVLYNFKSKDPICKHQFNNLRQMDMWVVFKWTASRTNDSNHKSSLCMHMEQNTGHRKLKLQEKQDQQTEHRIRILIEVGESKGLKHQI